jgi:hypothetical protein
MVEKYSNIKKTIKIIISHFQIKMFLQEAHYKNKIILKLKEIS